MRNANVQRNTNETKISILLDVDGCGKHKIQTGIGFFDHMLTHLAVHGFFDLEIEATGDTFIDSHHLVEDVGISIGKAFSLALADKTGINRYGSCILPMDETLTLCAVDLSGRTCLNYDVHFTVPMLGKLQTEMIREFFIAFVQHCPMNLHIKQLEGVNNHHIAEGIFKAFARALDQAAQPNPRITGILSTKGMLE